MKKTIVFLISALFLVSGTMAGIQHHTGLSPAIEETALAEAAYQHTFTFAEPTITTDTYTKVTVDNCDISHTAGAPALPYITHTLTLPWGSVIDNIEIAAGETTILPLATKVIPAAEPAPANMQHHQVTRTEGPIYQTVNPYPSALVSWHTGAGLHNGEHVLYLTLRATPTQYLPASQQLQYVTDINVNVRYTPGTMPLTTADSYDLLIITPEGLSQELEPLVEHKQSMGIATQMILLDDIYSGTYFSTEGRDDAEQVKYFIKNAVEQWGITYVMLVGGRHGGLFEEKWWCPVRYTNLDDNSNWEASYLSDLYFSDLYKYDGEEIVFADWDSNGNGVFAEWKMMDKDILDLYPDVYVGRLACRNDFEASLMAFKIIAYETSTAGQDWFTKFVGVAGDTYPSENDPYYEGELATQAAFENLSGFDFIPLWTSNGELTGPPDVIDTVNEGCGFLHFSGHGNPMGWSNHPPHDEETWVDGLTVSDMRQLSNDGMYPVCIVGGCHNNQFNVTVLNLMKFWEMSFPIRDSIWYSYIYKGEMSHESWGWVMTCKDGGGAIATIANTALGYGQPGEECLERRGRYMELMFFKSYGEGKTVLGETHGSGITYFLNKFPPMEDRIDCKISQQWALLGDPSLQIGGY